MWLVLASAAWADDLTFAVTRVVPQGESPTITFRAAVAGNVRAQLQCAGKAFSVQRTLPAGGEASLVLAVPTGTHACSGSVRFEQPSGDWAESPLAFEVSVQPPLSLKAAVGDFDRVGRKLAVHPSRPVAQASVALIGLGGETLETVPAALGDPSRPVFTWSTTAEVLKLVVTARDVDGIGGTLELSPWSYAIPHEDVVFGSGLHDITPAEAQKLERCWSDVTTVLDKYGSVVAIELFVAGFTDTVGTPASNRALSERRAAAIAGWFAGRGFRGPIWYQGFGEDALAVGTADEVDEVRNRRAVYLLSADRPPVSQQLPTDAWKRR